MPEWVRQIVMDVAARHKIRPIDIIRRTRKQPIVRARQEAMYLVKEAKPVLSFQRIAIWFRRDHKTVMHAIAKVQAERGVAVLTRYRLR